MKRRHQRAGLSLLHQASIGHEFAHNISDIAYLGERVIYDPPGRQIREVADGVAPGEAHAASDTPTDEGSTVNLHKTDPMIGRLRTVPGLSNLPDRTLARMVPFVDQTDVAPGQVLTREGVASRQAFIVVSGQANVFVDGELIATIGPGEFVGEMGMLDNQPRSATVRAETAMRLLVIGPRAFSTIVNEPSIAKAMATQLSQRLRRVDARAAC